MCGEVGVEIGDGGGSTVHGVKRSDIRAKKLL